MFKKVLYVFIVISFIFSVLTVRWYSRKFVVKKEKVDETPPPAPLSDAMDHSESDSDSGEVK
jgi:hypothetical protein